MAGSLLRFISKIVFKSCAGSRQKARNKSLFRAEMKITHELEVLFLDAAYGLCHGPVTWRVVHCCKIWAADYSF